MKQSSLKPIKLPSIKYLFSVRAHEKKITDIAVSKDCIFSASVDKTIKVWNKWTGKFF